MTTDGGQTWKKTLYIDADHGVADMDIDPSNPNIVYAVMWKFRRTPWTHTSGDERGGLFRSVDGGRTWKKLEGGLPKVMGRVGVAVAQSNPNVVYAITEAKEGTLWRSDDREPFYYVMGGLQDNGTWTGPSRTREPVGIQNDDWRMISFGDGFWVLNSADDPDLYLSESQGGNIVRTDMRTREQQTVVPYMGDDGGPAEAAK